MKRSPETGQPSQACQIWRVPECPFPIEWSAAMMEQIRLAAMEALFSVPHGGAEIGGVLWGTRADGRVRILAARPLLCEYALGPTFTLSGKDRVRLEALLQDGPQEDWEPVGWYHSHTRSEILLSVRDVEIHNRYFPEPWQVALVVRPHAMQPMRAGFFFREAGGAMHADSSYSEFPVQPAPQADMVGQPAPQADMVGQPAPQPVVEPAVSPAIAARPAPAAKRSRQWLWWVTIVLAMAEVLFVFKNDLFKQDWTRAFAADRPPSVSLMAYDLDGQLQIHWDWAAEPIRSAEAGTLEITDGAKHTVVALEKHRLRSGTVSYARISARVDVRLALRQPGGQIREEFTTFLGEAGGPLPVASAANLRRGLRDQAVRTSELERAVADLHSTARRGQNPPRQDNPR